MLWYVDPSDTPRRTTDTIFEYGWPGMGRLFFACVADEELVLCPSCDLGRYGPFAGSQKYLYLRSWSTFSLWRALRVLKWRWEHRMKIAVQVLNKQMRARTHAKSRAHMHTCTGNANRLASGRWYHSRNWRAKCTWATFRPRDCNSGCLLDAWFCDRLGYDFLFLLMLLGMIFGFSFYVARRSIFAERRAQRKIRWYHGEIDGIGGCRCMTRSWLLFMISLCSSLSTIEQLRSSKLCPTACIPLLFSAGFCSQRKLWHCPAQALISYDCTLL